MRLQKLYWEKHNLYKMIMIEKWLAFPLNTILTNLTLNLYFCNIYFVKNETLLSKKLDSDLISIINTRRPTDLYVDYNSTQSP